MGNLSGFIMHQINDLEGPLPLSEERITFHGKGMPTTSLLKTALLQK